MSTSQKSREVIREGAAEVKAKLRDDISHWSKFRRFITLAPTMACLDCEGTGRVPCTGCGGSGMQKLVWNDEETACPTCEGKATVTCTDCEGKGRIKNKRRKFFLWMFGVGGVAWAYTFFRLWGGDVAPELRSKYLHGGGGGGAGQSRFAPKSKQASPGGASSTATGGFEIQPGSNGTGQPAAGDGTGAPPANPPANLGSPRGGQMMPPGTGGLNQ